jgi:hypothetical protein
MKIRMSYAFTHEVIPPRCRKPRACRQLATMTLTIHEVTSQDAPVAILAHDAEWKDALRENPTPPVYRWWKQHLYQRWCHQRVSRGPWETQDVARFLTECEALGEQYTWDSSGYRSKKERRADLLRWAKTVLFIDSERWERVGEPRYVIMTFGLGHNHGLGWGTSLSTETTYNPNIPSARYYRIDQYDQAVATATAIARLRGDTKALPISQQAPTQYDILIPEAVRLCPRREHGLGDPFLRKVEALIEGSPSAAVAGIVLLATL